MITNELKKHRLLQKIKEFWRYYKDVIVSCLLFGFIAHGTALFNFYAINDQAKFLVRGTVGNTFVSGRWGLGILSFLIDHLMGNHHYSFPLINGLISIVFITVSAIVLINLFHVSNLLSRVVICGIMIATPVVSGWFGYMFTAPYYVSALLLTVLGTYIICKYNKWYYWIIAVIMLTFATGVYQAFISVALTIFILYLLYCSFQLKYQTLKEYILLSIRMILLSVLFFILYVIINRLFLNALHMELSSYHGISDMESTSIVDYFLRIPNAYKYLFAPPKYDPRNVYPWNSIYFYYFIGLFSIVLFFKHLYIHLKQKYVSLFLISLLCCVSLPICINFVYIMADINSVHNLMLYSNSLVILIPFLLFDFSKEFTIKRHLRIAMKGLVVLSAVMCIAVFVFFDNAVYLKADLIQRRLSSYYTTLVTQIKSVEKYDDEMPVVIVDSGHFSDSSISDVEKMDVHIFPYYGFDSEHLVNSFARLEQIKYFTGFSPHYGNASEFEEKAEVVSMPSYPDSGSIKVIDGAVVVKF